MLHRLAAFGVSLATLLLPFLIGCTTQNLAQVVDVPGAPTNDGLTYYQSTAPIIAAKCATCHQPGGIAPFALQTYADAKAHAAEIASAVQSRKMPPLPPQQLGCQALDDDRNLSEDDRMNLFYWAQNGAAEGDAAHPAAITLPVDVLGAPTVSVDSGIDYTSTISGQDDYRCFVIDPQITSRFDLIAADTTSTNRAIVHHVIVSAVPPASAAQAYANDNQDDGPGYECFGGVKVTGAYSVSASAVGSPVKPFPDGTGVPLAAGTIFVVQVHYNFANGRGANRLGLTLWKSPTPITRYPHGLSLSNVGFFIPAGAPDVEATATGRFDTGAAGPGVTKPGRLWGVFPHMHQLGRSITVELERADGTKACLMNIPAWDFHWQGSYQFVAPVVVNAGDKVTSTCVWDNSQDHQPMVNGVQQTTHDVRFGEGSGDEMCLTGLTLTD